MLSGLEHFYRNGYRFRGSQLSRKKCLCEREVKEEVYKIMTGVENLNWDMFLTLSHSIQIWDNTTKLNCERYREKEALLNDWIPAAVLVVAAILDDSF